MVPFAGYSMPVQYEGIVAEHQHTRTAAGLFDVSHMGQVFASGPAIVSELESVLPLDIAAMEPGQQSYTVLTNDEGGIRDDLIVTRLAEQEFLLVVNAACKQEDLDYLSSKLATTSLRLDESCALLALQGPEAVTVLEELVPGVQTLRFMQGAEFPVASERYFISRSGYTGEDGFEISLPAVAAAGFAEQLLSAPQVQWVGLGARDSLRLEAGLCLYGHDIDTATSPIEAGLAWSIPASRRPGGARAGGFPGVERIFAELEQGANRKRVMFAVTGRAPVREGATIAALPDDPESVSIGVVTSGSFGATLGAPCAMGYVDARHASLGSVVFARVRKKTIEMTVVKAPMVPHRYAR